MTIEAFVPNSSGDWQLKQTLAREGAAVFVNQLVNVMASSGTPFCDLVSIEHLGSQPTAIGQHLNHYQSDKASSHDYDIIYDVIITDKTKTLLEIGLGTNNTDVLSNMTEEGKPGASLRAFRDHFPNLQVYGADIDTRILFEEERIKTFYVDQLDHNSVIELFKNFEEKIDIIIDDGLHSPQANLNVLTWALQKVADKGWIIIEDIHEAALPVWYVVGALLPKDLYECNIISAKNGYLFMVNKK